MTTEADVIYAIDGSDAIVEVNDAWTSFAKANDGSSLLPPGILGRLFWDFIADPTTRHLYSRLFERVRSGAAPVRFGFRCDGPDVRRFLEMTLIPHSQGGVRISVHTVRVETRPAMTLLDPQVAHSDGFLRMCGWCNRIPTAGGRWVQVEEALREGLFDAYPPPMLSHGMCDDCERTMSAAMDDEELAASGSIQLGG